MQAIVSDQAILSSTASSSRSASPIATPSFSPNTSGKSPLDEAVSAHEDISISDLVGAINAKSSDGSSSASATPSGHGTLHLAVDDIVLPGNMDYTRPVSMLLKEGTTRAHADAEHSEGAAALVGGKLELKEYIRWMAALWRVYDAMELGLAEHASHPVLLGIYDPAVLARSNPIAKDIAHLLGLLPSAGTESQPASQSPPDGPLPPFPVPTFMQDIWSSPPAALTSYVSHLRGLAASESTAPGLLAHAYVRYLGDMSGGQFILARVKRAYGLKSDTGAEFYAFGGPAEDGVAEQRKRIAELKEWFRKGMDRGVGEDEALKAHLVKEANLAFALNTHLFSIIRVSDGETPAASTQAVVPTKMALVETLPNYQVSTAPKPSLPGIPTHHPDGTPLRYYEIRELEQRVREQQRVEREGPDQTWWQQGERFGWFVLAALIGIAFSKLGAPAIEKYVFPYVQSRLSHWQGE